MLIKRLLFTHHIVLAGPVAGRLSLLLCLFLFAILDPNTGI